MIDCVLHRTTLISLLLTLYHGLPATALLCYSCENEPLNSHCNNNVTGNIQVCDDGFDTCQTMVKFSNNIKELQITKFCTKSAPCGHQQGVSAAEDAPCDPGLDTWACVTCCHSDLCNSNSATSPHLSPHLPHTTPLTCSVLLSLSVALSLRTLQTTFV